jgi:hypothetical protein
MSLEVWMIVDPKNKIKMLRISYIENTSSGKKSSLYSIEEYALEFTF